MFNIGFGELLLIFVLALILIGPKQLPQIAYVIGKMVKEVKNAAQEFSTSIVNVQDQANIGAQQFKQKIVDEIEKSAGLSDLNKITENINLDNLADKKSGEKKS